MQIFSRLIRLLFIILLFPSCDRGENSIRLMPEGFEGRVVIIYDQQSGAPIEYEKNKRLYIVPLDGILRTKFQPNYGHQRHEYYYVTNGGGRIPIPFIDPWNWEKLDKSKNTVICFSEWVGTGGDKQGKKAHFRTFLVGRANQADSLLKLQSRGTFDVLEQ